MDSTLNLYRLSNLRFTSPYFSAMDCILNADGKHAIYCSTELTSGRRVYEVMVEKKVHTLDQLDNVDKKVFQRVKKANEEAAKAFASIVRADHKDGTMVINPAPLKIQGWEQPEYYAFWDELIRTRVKQIRFNDTWEFSSGCTYELAVALDEGIPLFDSKGNSLDPNDAVSAIEQALQWLHDNDLDEAFNKVQRHRDFCKEALERKEKKIRMPLASDFKRAEKTSAKPSKGAKDSVRATGRAK
jgi:hypothetical protein